MRDDASAFSVPDAPDRASDKRSTGPAATASLPDRSEGTTSPIDRSSTGRSHAEAEPASDDATGTASGGQDPAIKAKATARPTGAKLGKVKGDTTKATDKVGDTTDVVQSETPVLGVSLPATITAASTPASAAGDRTDDASAPAEPRTKDVTQTGSGGPSIDPAVEATATAPTPAPTPDAHPTIAVSDEGSKTAPTKDGTSPKDETLQSATLPQPQPVGLAVLAIPLPTASQAGAETGTEAKSVSGPAARLGGRAAASPAASGNAKPATPGAPATGVDEAEPTASQARPAGAVAPGEAVPSRTKGGLKADAGPQVATASPAGPVDFAAQLAQVADAAFAPAAQTIPGDPTVSASVSGDARAATAVPIGDVPVEIGLRALDGSSRFDIRLSPEDLGRIDVKLDIDGDGQVRAHLVVDRPETLAFLQRDGDNLHRAFEQAGFKPAETGIAFSLRDPGGDAGGGNRNGSGENGQRAQPAPWTRQDRETGPDPVPTSWRTLQAGRTGVDLHI